MSMRQLLSNLEENRWSWVKEGINEFREGFLRFSPTQTNKKEVLIGVYGPTQVGKTTLILKILGIREDKMKELSQALRGKREVGNSATVTATIYHRSPDERFSISYPNGDEKQFLTLDQFEKGMEDVRILVETDRKYSTKPIHIYFSELYFNLTEIDSRNQDITILDLPGDDSREEREVKHVDRCLREYLPHCRLCLVMEIGGQMVNLTQITREHVRDWSYLPEQFRVVLTRTLTSSSVREKIKNETIHSTESYIGHFKYELNRLLKENRTVDRLYPLELGESWQGLKGNDPNFYETVLPWINEVYQQLLEDIKAVESPEREVLQLLSLEDLASKRKQEEISSLSQEIAIVNKEKSDGKLSIKSFKKRISQVNEDINQFKTLLGDAGSLRSYTRFNRPYIYGIASWEARTSSERNVTSLRNDYHDSLNLLQKDYEQAIKLWNQSLRLLAIDYDLQFSPISYTFFSKKVYIDRLLDRYFRRSTFQEDYDVYERKLKESNKQTCDEIMLICTEKVEELIIQVKQQIRAKQLLIEEYEQSMNQLVEQSKQLEKKLNRLEKALEDTHKEWDHDIQRTNELYQYLKKSFTKKAVHFQELLESTHIEPEDKWAYHLYWNIITKDVERIIRYDHDNRSVI